MRLSSLCLASVLIFFSSALAQHSSSGGGNSGASSSGGSHASFGGSSSASSASSSGGSAAHGSSSYGSSSHGSSSRGSSASHTSSAQKAPTNPSLDATREGRDPNVRLQARTEMSGRQKFISFLRHPFRKSEPKAAKTADLRYRICFKGPCVVCPAGQGRAGGCAGLFERRRGICSAGEIWNGGSCLLQANFLDDCSGPRAALARQAQRAQAAESARQSACVAGTPQDCSNMTRDAQSESNLYQTLQARYKMCRQQSPSAHAFSAVGSWRYSQGLRSDSLGFESDYR
jgi:hypothetical protein